MSDLHLEHSYFTQLSSNVKGYLPETYVLPIPKIMKIFSVLALNYTKKSL